MKRSLILLLSCCVWLAPRPGWAVSSALGEFEAQVLHEINVQRSLVGLLPLLEDLDLDAAATAHSLDMATQGCFSHNSCDGTPWDARIRSYYTPPTDIGEIVAAGFSTPEAVMAAWMNSPDHKADILQAAFQVAGVSLFDAGPNAPYITYWTVDFGGRKTPKTVPGVIPEPASAALMALGLCGLLLAGRTQRRS